MVESGLKSAESKEQHRKLIQEIDDVQEHLDMLSRIERAMPGLPVPAPAAPVAATPESKESRRAKLNATFRAYLQGRLDNRIPEHQRPFNKQRWRGRGCNSGLSFQIF